MHKVLPKALQRVADCCLCWGCATQAGGEEGMAGRMRGIAAVMVVSTALAMLILSTSWRDDPQALELMVRENAATFPPPHSPPQTILTPLPMLFLWGR